MRGTFHQRGYTVEWVKYRAQWLRAHPLCGDRESGPSKEHSKCLSEGLHRAATDVDHIVPHRGDNKLFWERSNHQSLCHQCHSIKTAGEVNARKKDLSL
jgi:5-methylcytosine-specific restriction protein A